MLSNIIKRFIFYCLFRYLKFKYGNFDFEISFEAFSSGLHGKDNAQTQYNSATHRSIIQINLMAHHSFEDIRIMAFHEFRHVMQYNHFPLEQILSYNVLKDHHRRQNPDSSSAIIAYFYCPLEIDAKAFEKVETREIGWQIFHEIDAPGYRSGSQEWYHHCLTVAHNHHVCLYI